MSHDPYNPDSPRATNGIIHTGEATGILPVDDGKFSPVTVIANDKIRAGFDEHCMRQIANMRRSPGVTRTVLNPDGHAGYGAPIGCVMSSPSHIYPGPVGVDIKCSMSLLQLDLPAASVEDKKLRRALIEAILERTPTGPGNRVAKKGRRFDPSLGRRIVTEGASAGVLSELGIPTEWAGRCEDSHHTGHDGTVDALLARLDVHVNTAGSHGQSGGEQFNTKMRQLGSYGGGNHFGECEIVHVDDTPRATDAAKVFGLKDQHVAFMSHCGSRGWGALLADRAFKEFQAFFKTWGIPLPGDDRHMVHAPLGTELADNYINDMALGANFATVNHMLINSLVLDAFQEVVPGCTGNLVYFISHNIARQEIIGNRIEWVHRKGATRAFPAGHPGLKGTAFAQTGHPILLPGNPQAGSSVMVAEAGADKSCFSVNHGAGRRMSRTAATKTLNQQRVDQSFVDSDILYNGRSYPIDEAPGAYKDFEDVLDSVKQAGLASEVARLKARFVIKDGDKADD
jgi:tRNA-splicing ligase RtcB